MIKKVDLRRLQLGEVVETGNEDWPKILRRETGLIEFICKHGIGHPAPSSVSFLDSLHGHEPGTWSVHGCDGCCKHNMPDIDWRPVLNIMW